MKEQKILDLFSLRGKTAIVTGGAGRLGYQHCKILREAGATVYSLDLVENPKLDKIAIQEKVDITRCNHVFAVAREIKKAEGHIDILINNACFNPRVGIDGDSTGDRCWDPHEHYREDMWKMEFDIGLNAAFYCIQAVAKYAMIPQKSGVIVNVASTSAITAPDHRKYKKGKFKSAAYPVVKTAMLGLTRSWASYFASVAPGVRVNAICMGAVNFGSMDPEFLAKLGERNMLGRPARPDEYDGAILFLCSRASEFMTASTLIIDGGQTAW